MPMIDVYATVGTFPDEHRLAADLASAVMTIEQVPDIPMFRKNTAASVARPADDSTRERGRRQRVRPRAGPDQRRRSRPREADRRGPHAHRAHPGRCGRGSPCR